MFTTVYTESDSDSICVAVVTQLGSARHDCSARISWRWNLMATYAEHPLRQVTTLYVITHNASKDDTVNESL